jgi:hypothetical protein
MNNQVNVASVLATSDIVQEAYENWRLAQMKHPCTEFKYDALTQFCLSYNWLRHDSKDVRWVALARKSKGKGEQSDLPLHDDFGLGGSPPPTITVAVYLTAPSAGGELHVFASQHSTTPTTKVCIQAEDINHKMILRIPHGVWHRPAPHYGLRQALVYTEVTEPYWSIGLT